MSLLICKNVSFSYDGKTVGKNITFNIEKGDYICIVGENGVGKSTLIKGILQLKTPINGSISIGDNLKPREIGYLPQQNEIQKDFPASVFEIVLSGCLNKLKWKPFYSKKEKLTAEEKMKQLGILNLKKQSYRELSGGQQRRVLLARALCATEKLLVLDEPVAGLDPLVTKELYELIAKINKDIGLTVVMVSHDIQNVLSYANKVLHLHNNNSFFGTVSEYSNTVLSQNFAEGEENYG